MQPYRLIQIIGARPQIIKSAAIYRAVKERFQGQIELITLHTGQHYDTSMSGVFFEELGISSPDVQLNCGGGSHAEQTADIMTACSAQFEVLRPDGVLVYGDTNSTLAASLAAQKAGIPVFHVEAGLRSHNLKMPEECNRIATDHLSSMLFCPTGQAIEELAVEGLVAHNNPPSISDPGVYLTGDVMYDNSLYYSKTATSGKSIKGLIDHSGDLILATCHRPSNTDDPITFERILDTLAQIGETTAPVCIPLHPRVRKHASIIESFRGRKGLILIEPVSFIEMVSLLERSKAVITDSGGLQKEAFFHQRPCVVMRDETEWTELVHNGNSILSGNDPLKIKTALQQLLTMDHTYPDLYGSGHSASRICDLILEFRPAC